jgi:hypothetical protein
MITHPLLGQLESKGIPPEVRMTARYYRHPQFPSRCLILELNDGNPYLRFSKVPADFSTSWQLDKNNTYKGDQFESLINDFFKVESQEPPPGAPPFEVVLEACRPIVDRVANRFKRDRHYELNRDDLTQIAILKVRECWLYDGNKPIEEFQRIVSTSIWHKFESLLSKHYVTQSRAAAEVISITDDNIEMMPGEEDARHVERDELDKLEERLRDIEARVGGLSPIEKAIIREIHRPSPLIQQTFKIEVLRHNHLRRRGVRRLSAPRINILLMSRFTQYSEDELKNAYQQLMQKFEVTT